jgi:hypothetical protein
MDFHVSSPACRQLDLSAIEKHRRQSDSKVPVQSVGGSGGKDAGPRIPLVPVGEADGDSGLTGLYPGGPDARRKPGTRGACQFLEIPVEAAAVHDDSLNALREILDRLALWRITPDAAQFIQYAGSRDGEFFEDFRSHDAGAMSRLTGGQMLFEDFHIEAPGRQAAGCMQSRRSASDNNHVSQGLPQIASVAGLLFGPPFDENAECGTRELRLSPFRIRGAISACCPEPPISLGS